jgi:TonB family protein
VKRNVPGHLALAGIAWICAVPARAGEARITPPEVVFRADAVYPAQALRERREGTVVLLVTLDATGKVADVGVAQSAGKDLDEAAAGAVRKWVFKPARRGADPVASRIRIPFRFALPAAPEPPLAPPPTPPPSPAPRPAPPPAPKREIEAVEVVVRGRKRPPPRAPSDFVLDREVLTTAPRQSAADLLASAPGVYVFRPEGDAVAHQIFLRGFDAEHGQDVELTVGPVPINQMSHVHAQGYADLNFVIPEVVRSLRVTEGIFDPRQGDFAIAGSMHLDLGVAERGYVFRTSYGSFNTFRQLFLWAPQGEREETFAAAQVRQTSGFGQNRASLSGGAIGQYAFEAPGGFHGLAHVAAYGARAKLAGLVRLDDVQAGRVDFYGTYADPSAAAQSAFATRAQAFLQLERPGEQGARTELAAWVSFADYRSRENLAGYTQRSLFDPSLVGLGDLLEQRNRDVGMGGRATHRTERLRPSAGLSGHFELGAIFRTHFIDQGLNLVRLPEDQYWDRRIDAAIHASDLGLYADLDWRLGKLVHLRGGLRADVLSFNFEDRIGAAVSRADAQASIPGARRTGVGVAVGPRASLEVEPLAWLQFQLAYGEGFRSPQAQEIQDAQGMPFANARVFEGGVRLRPFGERLTVRLAGFATLVSADLAFEPDEGRLERIGPTTRIGMMAHVEARPWPWLFAAASVTWVRATLDEEPGGRVPYVPPVLIRADVGVSRDLLRVAGAPLAGRLGIGLTVLSERPLPHDQFADAVAIVDLAATLRWRFLELGVEIFNLFDARFAATEFLFTSDWRNRQIPSLTPARHITAGPPRTVLGTLGLRF